MNTTKETKEFDMLSENQNNEMELTGFEFDFSLRLEANLNFYNEKN